MQPAHLLTCYDLTLPLLFLLLLPLITLPSLKYPIPRTASLWSLVSLILFLLIPSISFLVLLLNLFPLIPFYVLGLILLIALLSSVPYALIVIPQSFALHLTLTRLMLTPSSTLPSAMNPCYDSIPIFPLFSLT